MSKTKAVFWGGFIDGHIDDEFYLGIGTNSQMPAIFKHKKDAQKRYDDTRRIRIALVKVKHK